MRLFNVHSAVFHVCHQSSSKVMNRICLYLTFFAFLGQLVYSKSPIFADVAIIFDLVPRRVDPDKTKPDLQHLDEMMQRFSTKDKDFPLRIDQTHTRMAILSKGEKETYNILVSLRDGTNNQTIANAKIDGIVMNENSQINDIRAMSEKISSDIFTEGDRPGVPNIIVYIGILPVKTLIQTENDWYNEAKNYTQEQIAWGKINIGVLVSTMQSKSGQQFGIVQRTDVDGITAPVKFNGLGEKMANHIAKAVNDQLGLCKPEVTVRGNQCFYKGEGERRECVFMRQYNKPAVAEKHKQFCVEGNFTWPCKEWERYKQEEQCEHRCRHDFIWKPSNCSLACPTKHSLTRMGLKSSSGDEQKDREKIDEFYKECETTISCKNTTCPTEDPFKDYAVLTMPVWGISVLTLCVVLLIVVFGTLSVYFCCFPPPPGASSLASRRPRWPWQRRASQQGSSTASETRSSFLEKLNSTFPFRRRCSDTPSEAPSMTTSMAQTSTRTQNQSQMRTFMDETRKSTYGPERTATYSPKSAGKCR